MGLIDLFKEFHSQATVKAYPASARVLYDTLLYEFNAAYWQEELVFSERELSRLTGLANATLHRAVKYLADRGHIKTWHAKKGTIIKLCGAQVKQKQSDNGALAAVSHTHTRKDAKDVKTEQKNQGARELEEIVGEWQRSVCFAPLDDTLTAELDLLRERHGAKAIRAAMDKARHLNRNGVSFAYFRSTLEDKKGREVNVDLERDYERVPMESVPWA